MTKITEENFVQHAMKCYDNIQCCTVDEFEDDLKRFLYLKKLFSKYHNSKVLRERLILNHLIVIYNVFSMCATDFLFFKIDKEYWNYLATFLVYLNRMPEDKIGEFSYDADIIDTLRKI
jgi:hypothetical protein